MTLAGRERSLRTAKVTVILMESADPRSRRESPGTCYDFRAMCYGRLRSPSSALAQSGLPACTASPGACAGGTGRLRSQYRALAQPVPGACAASTGRLRSQYRALAQPVLPADTVGPGVCAVGARRARHACYPAFHVTPAVKLTPVLGFSNAGVLGSPFAARTADDPATTRSSITRRSSRGSAPRGELSTMASCRPAPTGLRSPS